MLREGTMVGGNARGRYNGGVKRRHKDSVAILGDWVEGVFLPLVRRPSRYIGGEVNSVRKDLGACELRVALCFPDVYEVGMSNQGMAIIYEVLNRMESVAAERVFAPWTDAEAVLRDRGMPLFTLESKAAVGDFDVVAFSLTTELCYANVLNMLDLAGVAVRAADRGEDSPLVVAGGGMANCCEPMADFVDLFVLGEGEEAAVALAELLLEAKRRGIGRSATLLEAAGRFAWAYVPSLYAPRYVDGRYAGLVVRKPAQDAECHSDPERREGEEPGPRTCDSADSRPRCFASLGMTTQSSGLERTVDGPRARFENAVVDDLDGAAVPLRPIVPFTETVHERVSVEIMRGCPGRCRFCQASYCRRPIRYRSVERIVEIAKACWAATGFDTVSLLSLSTSEYPHLEELVGRLHAFFADKHVGLSLPSLRVDQELKLLPTLLTSVRKGGLTMAVEAASERVRRIIHKPIRDEDLYAAAEAAYRAGWQRFKLYFMVGLPGETWEDVRRIAGLCYELAKLRKGVSRRMGQVDATVSWFVPKPHTPLQWLGQRPREYFLEARRLILEEKRCLNARMCRFKFHEIECSVLESAIGRGGRELGSVIEAAWRGGARFDLWAECFDFELWRRAFAEAGLDVDAAAQRGFADDEVLPWEHLGGPAKGYLMGHLLDARARFSMSDWGEAVVDKGREP